MPKRNVSSSGGMLLTQSVYLFTTIVAFFSGVISAPIFMYLSNNYYDVMANMGSTRVTLSLFIFWLMLTIVFAVFFDSIIGTSKPMVKYAPARAATKSKAKSKKR